jgi:hypothetical protein
MRAAKFAIPSAPGGEYLIRPGLGLFKAVVPEATVNMCLNPSVEFNTTYWAGVNATIARTYDWQAFGWTGLQVTPTSSSPSVLYGTFATLAGGTYTASVFFQGTAGQLYQIYIASTAGALVGTAHNFFATGKPERPAVTYAETSSTTRRVYVSRQPGAYADLRSWYMDGLQIEAKSYPTTYCDGDQVGFVRGRNDYYWNGTAHASTSTRSVLTWAGGKEVDLNDLGFNLISPFGLDLAPIVPRSLPLMGVGSEYQGQGTSEFGFSLVGIIYGADLRHLQAQRAAILDAIHAPSSGQEMLLKYQLLSECGEPQSDTVNIRCLFTGFPDAGAMDDNELRCALTFTKFMPFVESMYDLADHLVLSTALTHTNGIVGRAPDGSWYELDNGVTNAAATDSGVIYDAVVGDDGRIYVGGDFDLPEENFTCWNPQTSNWDVLGSAVKGIVYTVTKAPNGDIYFGGDITGIAGAAASNVGRYNFAAGTFDVLGLGVDDTVLDSALLPDGKVVFVGEFLNAGGAAAAYFAFYTIAAATWGTTAGLDGIARACVLGPDDNLYVGGSFTQRLLYYDVRGKTNAFTALSANILTARPHVTYVYLLSFNEYGMLQVVSLETDGGNVISSMIRWTGTSFQEVIISTSDDYRIWACTAPLGDGSSFFSDGMTAIGGDYTLTMTTLKNDTLTRISLAMNAHDHKQYGMIEAGTGHRYMFGWYDTLDIGAVAPDASTTVVNPGTAHSYPRLYLAGPQTLYSITNAATGAKLLFDEMPIQANEMVTIDLRPGQLSIISSIGRTGLLSYLLPSTNLDWRLVPGNNPIVVLATGTTAAAYLDIVFKPAYTSIDGAVYS